MNGLGTIHLELTSRCNKDIDGCPMCGRRILESKHPELCDWGDVDFEVLRTLATQIPKDIVIQFFNNGEPLLYPFLGHALNLFPRNIRCLNTNGLLLMEKKDEIFGNLDTITISVVEGDRYAEQQFRTVVDFLEEKKERPPNAVYRLLGNIDREDRWHLLPGTVVKRVLHSPHMSRDYKKVPTKPETGICLDLLGHLAIDRYGNISMCVRFDPEGKLRIGNIKNQTLYEVWNGAKRKEYKRKHIQGKRDELPVCRDCHYWGCPTSP
jgi:radical SAM protein with 4Fe4S-binding SPASM domain